MGRPWPALGRSATAKQDSRQYNYEQHFAFIILEAKCILTSKFHPLEINK
jgi:hypothetical protein